MFRFRTDIDNSANIDALVPVYERRRDVNHRFVPRKVKERMLYHTARVRWRYIA